MSSVIRINRGVAVLAAGILTAAGVAMGAPAASAAPKQTPPGFADSWYTWTTGNNTRDCSSVDLVDQADSALCGRGLAHAYPQALADAQPQTLAGFREYVATVQKGLKPGERVTLQFDRYVGPRGQVNKVVRDGKLTPGEDAKIAKEWHVVVIEGDSTQYVTWLTATSSYDCSAAQFADLTDAALCGNGLAHVYPQKLAPEQPANFDALGAYLDTIKAGLLPGQQVTVQMDRYVGSKAEIQGVIADGVLVPGEDSHVAKEWRVVVLTGE